jgi:iron complex transport system substrate-binding protein
MDQIFFSSHGLMPKQLVSFQEEYNTTLANKKKESMPTVLCGSMFKTNGTCLKAKLLLYFYRTRTQIIYGQTRREQEVTISLWLFERLTMQNLIAPGDFSSLKQMGDSNPIIKNLML